MIGGRINNYEGGVATSSYKKYESCGYGYAYILKFIKEATTLTDEEMQNLKEIYRLQKSNPKVIEKYLMISKTEREVRRKMHKREELLNLLDDAEKQIILEAATGASIADISKRLRIDADALKYKLSAIYKKTSGIITYRCNRTRYKDLCDYLFKECGLSKCEIIDEPKDISIKNLDTDTVVNKVNDNCLSEVCNKPNEQGNKNIKIANVLFSARSFLEEKCSSFYIEIGRKITENPNCKIENDIFYQEAVNYAEAIRILTQSIDKLMEGVFKNV